MELQTLTIRRPDDWHVHLRDGAMLSAVARHTARQFARAIVMPNLLPPVLTPADAAAYRDRILAALPAGHGFTPLMTCYLTDATDPGAVARGHADGIWTAAKLYPAHATTNSAHGVTDPARLHPVFAVMERIGMPLLLHGEVTDPAIDIFDREAAFVERVLPGLLREFPGLKIVLEHITTTEAAEIVLATPQNLAATITPQHLHLNRNALFDGGLRPHAYCLPVVKRERHRQAIRRVATSGDPRFFLGTDSAPHAIGRKEASCGCAGIFNAPHALESYLQVFEEEGKVEQFEGFASEHGARFYGLPLNRGTVTLRREPQPVAPLVDASDGGVVPFHAGETLRWRLAD